VVTVTVGPAAPPVVPLRPNASTLAKPSACPGSASGAGEPLAGAAMANRDTAISATVKGRFIVGHTFPMPAPAGTIVGTAAALSAV
jgi:hypothetical protein